MIAYKPFTKVSQLRDKARVKIKLDGDELEGVLRYEGRAFTSGRTWVFVLPNTGGTAWDLVDDGRRATAAFADEAAGLVCGWRVCRKATMAAMLEELASESVELLGIAPPVRTLPNGWEIEI